VVAPTSGLIVPTPNRLKELVSLTASESYDRHINYIRRNMKLSNWSYDGDTSAGGRYISVDDGIRAQRDFRMLSHEQFVNEGVLPTSNNQLYFHPHWLRHRDVIDGAPDWFISGIGIYIMVVGLAGIVGNIGVVSVFLRYSFRVDLPNNVEMDVNAKIASSFHQCLHTIILVHNDTWNELESVVGIKVPAYRKPVISPIYI
jgi:hypothetical protein